MKRLCFITQRYGLEVNGGAELLCRQFAELLAKDYDVTVLTTKAIDYMTWKDEYPEEKETLNSVHVIRFSVESPRDQNEFNAINSAFLSGQFTNENQELEWVKKQGPYVPKLLQYLKKNHNSYDVFLFMTYLYYPTVLGVREVFEHAIVIPTVHDEPFLRMNIYKDVFLKPKAILYNTEEEKELAESKFHNGFIKNDIGGAGVTIPVNTNKDLFQNKFKVSDYILYVGRIDEGKNCHKLFRFFKEFKKRNACDTKLVLIGKPVIPIPKNPDIISLGFVSDEDKFNGIAGSRLLVLPSEYESLSMVVLETFALQRPVLVNGKCEVLKAHCKKSNAGLYYENYYEFEATLNYMLSHQQICELMGKNGKIYVTEHYQWKSIINKLEGLINYVCGGV